MKTLWVKWRWVVVPVAAIALAGSFYLWGRNSAAKNWKNAYASVRDSLALSIEGWTATTAENVTQKDLIKELQKANDGYKIELQGKIEMVANLQAQLAAQSGGGTSTPTTDGWKRFDDPRLTARYQTVGDSFRYTIKERFLSLWLTQVGGVWAAKGTNDLGDSLNIKEFHVKQAKPPTTWNFGIGGGFVPHPVAHIAVKHGHWSIEPTVGYDTEVKYGGTATWWVK